MWEIQHSTVDWDCSKTQTLLVTLKTQNRPRREFCHAAAVSSQRSSAIAKNNCNSGSHGTCAPMTFCWLRLNGTFWMNRRCSGLQLTFTQSPVTHGVPRRTITSAQITRILALLPDAKRPSRASPHQKSVIRCPTQEVVSCLRNVTMSKSLEELAREVARVQPTPAPLAKRRTVGPATKAGHCRCRSPHGWFLDDEITGCVAQVDRSFDVSRWKDGRVAPGAKSCETPRIATNFSIRGWDVPQVCEGACAPSGRRRRSRRYSGRVLGNSQHHQGSQLLAAVMDRWRHSADLGP